MSGEGLKISVIVTVRNEAHNISDLLDSLVVQEPPFEVVIVDSASTDRTADIVREYAARDPRIRLIVRGGLRGESRNYGVEQCTGDAVAFTDGDCIANPFWLREMRQSLQACGIVAGKTITMGYQAFVELDRVELYYKGYDLTFPSCNLSFRKELFQKIKGFDPAFVTAEDIDLNFRGVEAGSRLHYNERAIIYHRARSTFVGFFKQAFWNGFGRKQLTMKHGAFWKSYKPTNMLRRSMNAWYLLRLGIALLGYGGAILFRGKVK